VAELDHRTRAAAGITTLQRWYRPRVLPRIPAVPLALVCSQPIAVTSVAALDPAGTSWNPGSSAFQRS